MRIRSAPFTLLLALPAASPCICAADAPGAGPAQAIVSPSGPDLDKKTDLEARMDRVGKAFRKIRKQVGDPAQNASSLALLSTMEDAAREAADFTPAKAADLPLDQRAKFVDGFRAGLKELQARFAKLRAALEAGDNPGASAIVEDLQEFEKKEHKEFKKPKPD